MKAVSAMADPKNILHTHSYRALLCQRVLPLFSRWDTANSTGNTPRITLDSTEGGVMTSS